VVFINYLVKFYKRYTFININNNNNVMKHKVLNKQNKEKRRNTKKKLKIAVITAASIGLIGVGAGFYLFHLSPEKRITVPSNDIHTENNNVQTHSPFNLLPTENQKDTEQTYEMASKVFGFLFSFPSKIYTNEQEYINEYNRLCSLINQKFGFKFKKCYKMYDGFKIVDRKMYELGVHVDTPNIIRIHNDPRFLIMHYILGEDIENFVRFIDYYLKDEPGVYNKNEKFLDAEKIINQKKGVCYEKSIVLASYLESVGISTQIIVFIPPESSATNGLGIGHAIVMIASGKFKGHIFDPALQIIEPSFKLYMSTLMHSGKINHWRDENDSYNIIIQRLFRKEEIPNNIVKILDENKDKENKEIINGYIITLKHKFEKECSSDAPNAENILKHLEKYGYVSFSVR